MKIQMFVLDNMVAFTPMDLSYVAQKAYEIGFEMSRHQELPRISFGFDFVNILLDKALSAQQAEKEVPSE